MPTWLIVLLALHLSLGALLVELGRRLLLRHDSRWAEHISPRKPAYWLAMVIWPYHLVRAKGRRMSKDLHDG